LNPIEKVTIVGRGKSTVADIRRGEVDIKEAKDVTVGYERGPGAVYNT